MKIGRTLICAVVGWVTGIMTTYGLSVLMPLILPIKEELRSYNMPGTWIMLLTVMAVVSPFALAGGVVGGRMVHEGGQKEQILNAILFGFLFTLPGACVILWYLGW
jgi:hypothetical protein